jgi:hypothetical protein
MFDSLYWSNTVSASSVAPLKGVGHDFYRHITERQVGFISYHSLSLVSLKLLLGHICEMFVTFSTVHI